VLLVDRMSISEETWAALPASHPAILGGTGGGFFQVEYTDVIELGGIFPEGAGVDLTAGDLSYGNGCLLLYPEDCAATLTDTIWSGWIPFTFGDPVTLPDMSVSFALGFLEGPGNGFTATESVTAFDIVDANMNPIAGAYADDAPEPSVFCLCGFGLALLAAYRRHQKRSEV
jgi:hypothetical protein